MENDIWNEISSFLNQLRCENINRESYIYFQELANIQLKKKMEKEKVNKLLDHISYEDREKCLLENYLEAADGADTITLAQVQEAEGITISYELRNTHKKVYTDWQTANPEQDTEEAAYDAGVKVCTSYGIPVGYNTPEVQEKRGGNAAQVYAVMLGVPYSLRNPLRLRSDSLLRPCDQRIADSLRSFPQGARGQGGAVPDA